MKIIGFDGSRAFNKDRTGTENYSYQLLLHLAKIDQKNQYLVYLHPGSSPTEIWPENFKFVTIKFPRFWTQFGLAKQTFQDELDVLFIPAHTSPLIHKKGLKTVVTVHDLGAEFLPKMHQIKQRLYLKWITNYQLKSATKLIAVSKATKHDLINRVGINANKIEVVYEGINENFLQETYQNRSLEKFGLKKQAYFLFVGTIQPRKNLVRLIEAFMMYISRGPAGSVSRRVSSVASLPSATRQDLSEPLPLENQLVLVGGKGWLSDEIYKLPKKLGIEDRVKFLGRVDDKYLPALYSGAIALIFPSLFEGFGLPILEAFACSCPVVCSNNSSLPEVAGNAAILVDPYNVNEIASGMAKLLDTPERESLIKKGLVQLKKFSWEKCAKETLLILDSL